MTEQTWVKGVEKDRTNNSTRECYKIAKQAKTEEQQFKRKKRDEYKSTTNKTKVQDDRMTEQTLRHRNTGVQNRQKQRGTRGENKQKTTIIL